MAAIKEEIISSSSTSRNTTNTNTKTQYKIKSIIKHSRAGSIYLRSNSDPLRLGRARGGEPLAPIYENEHTINVDNIHYHAHHHYNRNNPLREYMFQTILTQAHQWNNSASEDNISEDDDDDQEHDHEQSQEPIQIIFDNARSCHPKLSKRNIRKSSMLHGRKKSVSAHNGTMMTYNRWEDGRSSSIMSSVSDHGALSTGSKEELFGNSSADLGSDSAHFIPSSSLSSERRWGNGISSSSSHNSNNNGSSNVKNDHNEPSSTISTSSISFTDYDDEIDDDGDDISVESYCNRATTSNKWTSSKDVITKTTTVVATDVTFSTRPLGGSPSSSRGRSNNATTLIRPERCLSEDFCLSPCAPVRPERVPSIDAVGSGDNMIMSQRQKKAEEANGSSNFQWASTSTSTRTPPNKNSSSSNSSRGRGGCGAVSRKPIRKALFSTALPMVPTLKKSIGTTTSTTIVVLKVVSKSRYGL